MTTLEKVRLVGAGVDRVDGPRKVTGTARYPNDFDYPNLAHAALVRSTVAAGRIRGIDAGAAEASPGVLAVITHANAPRLERAPAMPIGSQPPTPLQDDRILHYGDYVGLVVADTPEQAIAAARLIDVDYEPAEPMLDLDDPRAEVLANPWGTDQLRGDVAAELASAAVTVKATYATPDETNNPLGLFSTVAIWDGNSLTVHYNTQWPESVRSALAAVFRVAPGNVRVLAPYVGGGFGAGLLVWPHVVLTVLAARTVARPVKLVLTRPQMFTGIGHRPCTVQQLQVAATRSGDLMVIDHQATTPLAMDGDRICVPKCRHARPAEAPQHPLPRVDARARRSAGQLRAGIRPGRAVLRPRPRPAGAPAAQLRRDQSGIRPALVQQGTAGLLSAGSRAIRLVGQESAGRLHARRPLASRLRHGGGEFFLVSGALPGAGIDRP